LQHFLAGVPDVLPDDGEGSILSVGAQKVSNESNGRLAESRPFQAAVTLYLDGGVIVLIGWART
jgi:hypothetical protein